MQGRTGIENRPGQIKNLPAQHIESIKLFLKPAQKNDKSELLHEGSIRVKKKRTNYPL